MIITITINPAVESVGIQTIAVALKLSGVTDAEARTHLGNHLRDVTAKLYVQGDQMKRAAQADSAAVAAAASQITVS
jgi:hypothetical protein